MEKSKNKIKMVNYYLKVNILMIIELMIQFLVMGINLKVKRFMKIEFSTLLSTKNLISNNDFEVINFEQF